MLLSAELKKTQTRVNLDFLGSGFYVLQVMQQNAMIKHLKILKN